VTRRQKRKIIIIAVLVMLLLLLGAYYAFFRATKQLNPFDIAPLTGDALPAPTYLYSITGPDEDPLQRPLGVYVDDDKDEVYVSDSRRQKVEVFDLDGEFKRAVGGEEIVVPLYIAENPNDGNIWVTDRRTRSIHIYSPEGQYLQDFEPNIPEEVLAPFATEETPWVPVALAFAPDGTLYVTDILTGHRLLIFDAEGKFKKTTGTVGLVTDAALSPDAFQFPNSIKVIGEEVWIADSNNRRIKVYNLEGDYQRIIVTDGLPRGLDFLNRSEDSSATDKAVVVDTLAHDATIWSATGDRIVNFGERGLLEGQFMYPNDVSIGPRNLIFIADTSNGRVQVWGWPQEVSPVPVAEVAQYWKWCLVPLLLLPLLLLLRKKRFFATKDFVDTMLDLELVEHMPARRRKWLVEPRDYELLKEIVQGDVNLGELLEPAEHSESDAKALEEKLEIDAETAVTMSIAQRAHIFCTENTELRRIAKVLEIDVVDHDEFMDRFANKKILEATEVGDASGNTPGEE